MPEKAEIEGERRRGGEIECPFQTKKINTNTA